MNTMSRTAFNRGVLAGAVLLTGLSIGGCACCRDSDCCAADAITGARPGAAADRLVEWLSGSFDSAAQAAEDESYFDISLHMAPVWTGRDGRWLYVEQALGTAPERPYRQRVYRIEPAGADGQGRPMVSSAVYELPDPEAFIGAFRDDAPFAMITPADLIEREGCTVYLTWIDDDADPRFEGATRASDCTSSLRGASYATSVVVVRPGAVESWDRGFDADGGQVWGAVDGPYRFQRLD